jgi:hypothetical protein
VNRINIKTSQARAAEQSTAAFQRKKSRLSVLVEKKSENDRVFVRCCGGMVMATTDPNTRRLQLIDRVLGLPDGRLAEAERLLASLQLAGEFTLSEPTRAYGSRERDWHHSPMHRISEAGTYIVTAATLDKLHHFRGAQ